MKLYKFSSLASLQRVSESLALSLRSLPSIGDMASPSTWRTNHYQEKELTLSPLPSTKAIDCSSIWKTTTQKHWNCIFISVVLSNQIDRSWKIHLFSYLMQCIGIFAIYDIGKYIAIVSLDFYIVHQCKSESDEWLKLKITLQKIPLGIFMTRLLWKLNFLSSNKKDHFLPARFQIINI